MHPLLKVLFVFLILTLLIAIVGYFILRSPSFGKAPSGERLVRIQNSPHYRGNQFDNLLDTPAMAPGATMVGAMYKMLFKKSPQIQPKNPFEFTKTDLFSIPLSENTMVWMGHSSYYLQLDGKRILVDPVFSGHASPFSFSVKAFKGSDLYETKDIPPLDYLIITHDHWDHLDYKTVKALFNQTQKVITGLGTGEHLEFWGLESSKLVELDWYESHELTRGYTVYSEPARHFSGRGLKRNQTLWSSFLLQFPTQKVFIGGDSGYGDHFKEIGKRHDSIDLAILENGQYNEDWRYIHFLPGENLKAMEDLKAKTLVPVHYGKFALALHAWNEPISKMMALRKPDQAILTPKIGERIDWSQNEIQPNPWWQNLP
ncbi:MBL fold metallo-hydrolase [Chryseobacterium sp. A321]